jgi:hypothetical protein
MKLLIAITVAILLAILGLTPRDLLHSAMISMFIYIILEE